MTPFNRSLPRTLAALALTCAPLTAQEEDGELESFFDAVEVKIVNVDIVALDKDGNPVTDLEREEFQLYEDGEPVEIVNFYRAGEEAAALAASRVDTPPVEDSRPATTRSPPLTMAVFVDNTSLVPGNRRQILEDLKDFLSNHLQANDRIILLTYDGRMNVVQQPTDSVDELMATIAHISDTQANGALRTAAYRNVLREISTDTSLGSAGLGLSLDATQPIAAAALQAVRLYAEESHANTLRTLSAVREALGMLSALPGPKAMIYAGAGMTQNPATGLVEAWERRFSDVVSATGDAFPPFLQDLGDFDATPAVQDVARVANTHRVTLYSLNPADGLGGLTPVEVQGMDAAGNRTLTPRMQSLEVTNRAAVMNLMASSTGGTASTGAMDNLLDTVRRDYDSLYSLAYEPADDSEKKDHRRIKVEVTRPGVELRYRHHYRETTPDERLADRTRSALLLEDAANPLGVAVEFGTPEEGEDGFALVPVMVRVPMSALTLLPQGEAHEGRMSLFIGARDSRGRLAPVSKQTLPLRISNADLYNALSQVGGYTFTLKLRPMAHTVAVTVHDEVGRVESVAQASFEAPDFG